MCIRMRASAPLAGDVIRGRTGVVRVGRYIYDRAGRRRIVFPLEIRRCLFLSPFPPLTGARARSSARERQKSRRAICGSRVNARLREENRRAANRRADFALNLRAAITTRVKGLAGDKGCSWITTFSNTAAERSTDKQSR